MTNFFESAFWHASHCMPKGVFAAQTFSIIDQQKPIIEPYLQQNLALHVGDKTKQVQSNRIHLLEQLQAYGVNRLVWLNQTHSTTVYRENAEPSLRLRDGDGLVTQEKGVALVMMTADCLPIVISNQDGTEIACLHAGWRGLADGIIESTVSKMQTPGFSAWIGAAISQQNFEVGAEVKAKFEAINADYANDFLPKQNGKFLADLYSIAIKKLNALGVKAVSGADRCSYAEKQYFYSYRRQAHTGRMATFVFISANG